MKLSGNTILITGGATGIGFALARSFVRAGSEVVVCGRREDMLAAAKRNLPELHFHRCDVSTEKGRIALHDWAVSNFGELNVLVNNAGIQRMIDLRKGTEDLLRNRDLDGEDEIEINLKAYVYLSALFIPDLLKREESAIINVSSGLGFVPMTAVPIYSATKAAIHSFSLSLRHQLRGTPIKVFELIPPTVDTDLDKGARAARGQKDRGIPPEDVAKAAVEAIENDRFEAPVGMAQNIVKATGPDFDRFFSRMNG